MKTSPVFQTQARKTEARHFSAATKGVPCKRKKLATALMGAFLDFGSTFNSMMC